MLLSCEPLHSWDRERSNTHAKSPRFVRKGFRHPFFLHSAASAITSPPHKAYSLGVFLIKGPRFWSRARSRLLAKAAHVSGGKICPEFAPRDSWVSPFVESCHSHANCSATASTHIIANAKTPATARSLSPSEWVRK